LSSDLRQLFRPEEHKRQQEDEGVVAEMHG
jgi:hypothetical protein